MVAIAFSAGGLVPAFACEEKKLYALQFYAEANDPDGLQILANFAGNICGLRAVGGRMEAFLERAEASIRSEIRRRQRPDRHFGGVDSAVCAALLHRAHRRPPQVHLHRHGPDAQGRAGAGDLHVPRGAEHGTDQRGRAAARSQAPGGHRLPRRQARSGGAGGHGPCSRRRPAHWMASTVWRWAPSTRTCSPALRDASPALTGAWSLCACCSRTRCASLATCWACRAN